MSVLFRKSVIEKQSQYKLGDIVLSAPFTTLFITIFLGGIALVFLIFISLGEYSRKERVVGFLTPEAGLVRIVPRYFGQIADINVSLGQQVKESENLFSIKVDTFNSQGVSNTHAQLNKLNLEKEELENIVRINNEYNQLSKDRVAKQTMFNNEESKRLKIRINLQEKRVKNELQLLNKLEALKEENAFSKVDVSIQENKYLESSQVLMALKNEFEKMQDKAIDLQKQQQLIEVAEQREASETKQKILVLEQRILETKNKEQYFITSPVDGEVVSLTVSEGQNASPQRAIAAIIPSNSELIAHLLVPSRAAGQVKSGQKIRLLYDAFPFQKFGFHLGEIVYVSRSVINTTDLEIAPSVLEPVFLVKVKLNQQTITTETGLYKLQAGMMLAADIVLEERKIWEWLFEPLLKVIKR